MEKYALNILISAYTDYTKQPGETKKDHIRFNTLVRDKMVKERTMKDIETAKAEADAKAKAEADAKAKAEADAKASASASRRSWGF